MVGTYVSWSPGHVYKRTVGSVYPKALHVRVLLFTVMKALGDPKET